MPAPSEPQGVVGSLVRTILSQNTTGRNSEAAYRSLRTRLPDWRQVADARLSTIAAAIRGAGLARQRSKTIQDVVRRLVAEDPSLGAAYLRHMPTAAAVEYLRSLPGVGPKTAACVALFELGRAVFPVDTHVLRLAKRLGWVGTAASAGDAQAALEPLIPRRLRYELHVNLIRHGRATCGARRARCGQCVLEGLCPRLGVVVQ